MGNRARCTHRENSDDASRDGRGVVWVGLRSAHCRSSPRDARSSGPRVPRGRGPCGPRTCASTSAVDEMAEAYRFDQQVERMSSFSPIMPGPVDSPFFADVQRVGWTGQLLGQTRMLVYSLLAPDALGVALEGGLLSDVDGVWASDLVAALDKSRLSSLVLADIRLPRNPSFATPPGTSRSRPGTPASSGPTSRPNAWPSSCSRVTRTRSASP